MPFKIQDQEQDLWCWAAVAASIDDYFSPGASKSQPVIAARVLGQSSCVGVIPDCNRTAKLQDALEVVERLEKDVTHALEFSEICRQIDQKLPVCARIRWFGTGAHFVVITGYGISKSGKQLLMIQDPWYPESTLTYEEFGSAYLLGRGEWSDSFYVKK